MLQLGPKLDGSAEQTNIKQCHGTNATNGMSYIVGNATVAECFSGKMTDMDTFRQI